MEVTSGKRTMTTIEVTADHIRRGVRFSYARCPVALSLADAFPAAGGASVDTGSPRENIAPSMHLLGEADSEPVIAIAEFPAVALDFARTWDRGEPVFPFSFEVEFHYV